MQVFDHPFSFGFIKHLYFSFRKKLSLIRSTHNFFLKKIKINGKTIDLGSGEGSNLTYYDYIDHDNADVENADFFKDANNKVDLEQTLLIDENKYDTIILFNTIEHIENYKKLISEIHKILKKNGKLELFVPFLVLYHPDPKDIFRPTHFYLEKILTEQGFYVNTTLIGVGPFFAAYQSISRYLKFPLMQTVFFIVFEIFNKIAKNFSKDYSNYYCGIHASCNKK